MCRGAPESDTRPRTQNVCVHGGDRGPTMHTCELCLLSVMKAGGGEHVGRSPVCCGRCGITRIADKGQVPSQGRCILPSSLRRFCYLPTPRPRVCTGVRIYILAYLILGIRSVTESQISTNDYFPGAHARPQHLMRALPFRVRPSKKFFSQILRKLGFPDDERTCWRTFG